MKTIVSTLGIILLGTAMALAQTATTSGGTSTKKSTKKGSTTYSSSSAQNGSAAATDSSASTAKAGNSGFDAGLPQSDSNANTAGSGSGQAGSTASMPQTTSSASVSTTQSGSSNEISNGPVAETVADSSAVIGWSTQTAASNTGLKYGTNRANLSETVQATDGADGKNHHARLQGLSPNTRYYFQVTENGQPVGGVGTFKTTATGDTPVQSKAVIPQK